jgi:hypothetical protein
LRRDYSQYVWIAHSERISASAQNLLMKWGESGVRTLDSIPLASVLSLHNGVDIEFHSADQVLLKLMQAEFLGSE